MAEEMCVMQGKDGKTDTHEDGTSLNGLHPAVAYGDYKRQAYWLIACNDFSTCTPTYNMNSPGNIVKCTKLNVF